MEKNDEFFLYLKSQLFGIQTICMTLKMCMCVQQKKMSTMIKIRTLFSFSQNEEEKTDTQI